jgi:hypothetical protein
MTKICTGLWEIMHSKFWYQRPLGGRNKLRHYVIIYIAITCAWPFNSLRLVSWTTTTTTTTIVCWSFDLPQQSRRKILSIEVSFSNWRGSQQWIFPSCGTLCHFHPVRQAIMTYVTELISFLLKIRSVYTECSAHGTYYIVICCLSGSTVFLTLSHKWHDFRGKKKLLNKKYFLIFSENFV